MVRTSPGWICRSSCTQSSGLSLPRTTVARSPPSQRAESTRSFSKSSKATQGPIAVSATISTTADATKPISELALGSSEASIT